ncbi:DNA internalization-related competence protein ComEC/Rec2 [Gayadomonas joobiniege]|uniref:DNA internalization-related competence protein ComEC/Rec2 n=1 Tax=Gayadomonas joobiniege TaxID=1234606 RepID=UPI00035ED9A2|nr:DNA internalization-related competence protein ComEC/Rec2 [Gayadomonas joobiniege]
MHAILIAFIGANIMANYAPIILTLNEIIVTSLLFAGAIILRYYWIASLISGFCIVSITVHSMGLLPPATVSNPQTLLIEGQVAQIPQQTEVLQRFNFTLNCASYQQDLKQSCSADRLVKLKRIRLSWYQNKQQVADGQTYRFIVKLKPVNGLANEAGFDYQKWLYSEGIQATGYVKTGILLNPEVSWRAEIFSQLSQALEPYQTKPLMLALSMGYRGHIDSSTWSKLERTGTAHLLAISGLHIGLVFIGSGICLMLILRLLFLPIYWAKGLALAFALMITWGFTSLTGFSLSAMRAATFITIFCCLSFMQWRLPWSVRFLLATGVILILFPLSPLSISFWLSFGAAAAVILSIWLLNHSGLFKPKRPWITFLLLQSFLLLLLMPMQAILFQHVAVFGWFANIVAIPLVSFILLPDLIVSCLALFWQLEVAKDGFYILDLGLSGLLQFLSYLSEPEWAYWPISDSGWLSCLLVLAIGIALLLPVRLYLKIVLVTLNSLVFMLPSEPDWQLDVIDVGQGLAVMISKQDQAVVYDTGDAFSSGFNLFEAAVEPVLLRRNLSLKGVIISHPDKDHAGGVAYINKYYRNVPILQNNACLQLNALNWLNLNWQSWRVQPHTKTNKNDASCVVKVSGAGHSVLLTGDIERAAEQQLLDQVAQQLDAEILIVPHHGSRTSSSIEFINKVNAQVAVVSSGIFNRFNHPDTDVILRYQQAGYQVYNTAWHGQINVRFVKQEKMQIRSEFEQALRPWFRNRIKGDLSQQRL